MSAGIPCAVCGENRLHLEQSERTVEIDEVEYKVPFHTHWCDSCGTMQGLNEDLRFNARAMRQIRKKHIGLLTGSEVRACRKKLGLNQEQAAKLFGGGPVAFSKYENDEVAQSDAMDRLLWLVSEFPGLMTPLAERLKLSLPGSACVVIEKMQGSLGEEFFMNASASIEYANSALEGFGKITIAQASNDMVYQTKKDIRPVIWKAA